MSVAIKVEVSNDGSRFIVIVDHYSHTLSPLTRYTMPRVTKKEKEMGKAAKPKPKGKPYENRNPKTTGGRDGAKKTGFRVGPAHAPRDAYLGKGTKNPT
jgi:hypothetical protein